jgi:anti-sigma factor RsiW
MNASGTNMNCEQYKEAIAADPTGAFDGADHAGSCEACRAFTAEMQALDAKIARALDISVPALTMPELPPVEDDNVVSLPVTSRSRTQSWLAIAAALALAAIIGVQFMGNQAEYESLEAEILAHLDHEPGALTVTNVAVSDERLSSVVNPSVGTMDRNVGLISYAQSCVINGKTVPHLVIQGESGPITLLLMPDEMVDVARTFMGERVNGVLIPHGGGSIAIIGGNEEDLTNLERSVVDSVEWSI